MHAYMHLGGYFSVIWKAVTLLIMYLTKFKKLIGCPEGSFRGNSTKPRQF